MPRLPFSLLRYDAELAVAPEWIASSPKSIRRLGFSPHQDLRDTAVTWPARPGCTIPQIFSITGHSEVSATCVLRHYLLHHRELADQAIAKVVAWYEGQENG